MNNELLVNDAEAAYFDEKKHTVDAINSLVNGAWNGPGTYYCDDGDCISRCHFEDKEDAVWYIFEEKWHPCVMSQDKKYEELWVDQMEDIDRSILSNAY